MDDLFTQTTEITEKEIRLALCNEPLFSPKEKTLDFIKNFARSVRAENNMDVSVSYN